MKLDTFMWLLLVVFMFHEFEEIIMMKPWINKNAHDLQKRFPSFTSRFLPVIDRLSTSSFALAIGVEFLLFGFLIYFSVEYKLYALWTSLLLVFTFHLIFHILSFMLYRKYVPVILTSILCVPYCLYAWVFLKNSNVEYLKDIFQWLMIVVVIGAIIFIFALWVAVHFEKWLKNNFIGT
jgi:hypothetical protein